MSRPISPDSVAVAMGVRNLRAICPNCGGKIHTQPKGLGHFTWANSWLLVQTGTECQHCGVALSGKVGPGNKAILAEDADKSWWEREAGSNHREEEPVAASNPGPILTEEQETADVVEHGYAASPDEVFAAVETAIMRLGYRSSAQSVVEVLASRESHELSFKAKGRQNIIEVAVRSTDSAAILSLSRKKQTAQTNEITRLFLGAVQDAL